MAHNVCCDSYRVYNVTYIYCTKVKWSRYRPCVAQRVSRGIALLFHDRGTRRGWVVSSTPRPRFTPRKDPVPILQEVGWTPGPVWKGGKSRPHRDSIPDRPARSQSLYQLSCPAHISITLLYLYWGSSMWRVLACYFLGHFFTDWAPGYVRCGCIDSPVFSSPVDGGGGS